MKPLFTTMLLFITSLSFAQKQNVYFLKNNGRYVNVRDSADFVRIVREPDSASTLYNVFEFYLDGKRRLIGKSATIDPPELEGQCMTYFPGGARKTISNYSGGKRVGPEYNFYPNGKTYLIKEFAADGQPDGFFRKYQLKACYDSLGTMLAENGDGHVKIYNDDFNAVNEEGDVKNGWRQGGWKGYDNGQKAAFTETYTDGQLTAGKATFADGAVTTYAKWRGTEPQFNGGVSAFGKYLGDNIRYPDYELKNNIQGRVLVTFVVEKDGSVSDVKVSLPASPGLDREALRIIKRSVHWIPGTLYGKPVRVIYSVPVNFSLAN